VLDSTTLEDLKADVPACTDTMAPRGLVTSGVTSGLITIETFTAARGAAKEGCLKTP